MLITFLEETEISWKQTRNPTFPVMLMYFFSEVIKTVRFKKKQTNKKKNNCKVQRHTLPLLYIILVRARWSHNQQGTHQCYRGRKADML